MGRSIDAIPRGVLSRIPSLESNNANETTIKRNESSSYEEDLATNENQSIFSNLGKEASRQLNVSKSTSSITKNRSTLKPPQCQNRASTNKKNNLTKSTDGGDDYSVGSVMNVHSKYASVKSSGYGQTKSQSEDDNCSSVGNTRGLSSPQRKVIRKRTSILNSPQRSTPERKVLQELSRSDLRTNKRSGMKINIQPPPNTLDQSSYFLSETESEPSWAKVERQKQTERLHRSSLTSRAQEFMTQVNGSLIETNETFESRDEIETLHVECEDNDNGKRLTKSSSMKKAKNKIAQWMNPLRIGNSKPSSPANSNDSRMNSTVILACSSNNQIKSYVCVYFMFFAVKLRKVFLVLVLDYQMMKLRRLLMPKSFQLIKNWIIQRR